METENLLIRSVELQDVDEQADILSGWEQEYQQLGHGKFSGTVAFADAGEFRLVHETTNQALHESVMPPEDQVVVAMCLNSEGSTHIVNGKVLDRNSLFMIDGTRAHDIRSGGYLELSGVAVDRDDFFSKAHEQDAGIASDLLKGTVTQLAPRAADMLRQYFVMVSDLLHGCDGPAAQGIPPRMLASSVMSNIALAVALSRPGEYTDTIPKQKERRDRIVQNAIDYMRKNASEEIGILDVCAATCVSRRTLQYCFEERLNISPLQYLKALRLNQARRELKHLAADKDSSRRETVANIAALCGFQHASRFASDYKRMFGELPSQIKA